jgi:hypothetical protein
MLETWTIREAQAASELVGEDAVYAVCGAAGLSGASSAELTALCELGRMWADPAGAPVPSAAELDGWETDRLTALTVLWRGLCDGGREDVWLSLSEHEATGDELRPWAYRWFDVQHVAALTVLRRRDAEAEAEARATVARLQAELGLNGGAR